MTRLLTAVLTLVSLGAFVIPVGASTLPISGTISGTVTNGTFSIVGPDLVATTSFSGSGNTVGVPSPPFTETSSATLTLVGPSFVNQTLSGGTFSNVHSNGTLFGTFTGTGVNNAGVVSLTIDDVFTGGTGFYAGASGTATVSETVLVSSGAVKGTFTGTLDIPSQVPLPAALPLFATGLGALGLLGWRRKRKAQATA